MDCKNCKESMERIENGDDDGIITFVFKCPNCEWKVKVWFDADEVMLWDNESWLNEKGKCMD